MGSRLVLRDILRQFYFKAPFRLSREWENMFIDAISQLKIGDDYYPGNYSFSPKWPHIVAGTRGVLNAMSPQYANLSAFLDVTPQPEVLWIRGEHDIIVSNQSLMEFGHLGELGIVPGWPGKHIYPPQPMIDQIRYFFGLYRKKGGIYSEVCLSGGHMCILESPDDFLNTLKFFIY